MKAIFFDLVGTVIEGVPTYDRVDSLEKVKLLRSVVPALKLVSGLEYSVFFVTNQAGIAEGRLTEELFAEILKKTMDIIKMSGVHVIKTYMCPHGLDSTCECRKPKPKFLLDAAQEYGIDLAESWMLGDAVTDVETGVNAGAKTILVKSGIPTVESKDATYTAANLLDAVEYITKHG